MTADRLEQVENGLIEVAVEDQPDDVVVRISGRATFDQADRLARALLEVAAKAPRLVVFDLAELTELNSLFLDMLVHFRGAIRRRGGEVRLANLQPQTWHMFAVCRLLRLFPMHELPEQELVGVPA